MTTSFDTTLNEYIITISGDGFTGDTSSTELYLDGTKLTITSLTSSSLVATISGLLDVTS